jgi:hypothetical protein
MYELMFSAGMDNSNIVIEPEEAPSEDSSDAEDEKDPCSPNSQHAFAQNIGNEVNILTQKHKVEYGAAGFVNKDGKWGSTPIIRGTAKNVSVRAILNTLPKNVKVKFLIHGHPDRPSDEGIFPIRLSRKDLIASNRVNLDLYATSFNGTLSYYENNSLHETIIELRPESRLQGQGLNNCPVKIK